ncbi:MAG TPA: VOC family protein [Streptosporangiaceae bacterium]|jgi:4a-hydroxytetrahydrobiopterin dehydratase
MTETETGESPSGRLTTAQFEDSPGVTDWRVLWGAGYAAARFLTGSLAAGLGLVAAIGELAAAVGHDPDIDVRPQSVTVRVSTTEVHGLTSKDVDLAREISVAAARLQAPADSSKLQHIQVAIDALDTAKVRAFWRAVLGYVNVGEEDLLDAHGQSPNFWFQQMAEPRAGRNRFHIDIYVPRDQVQARIGAALAAGGHIVSDAHAPHWWTLADPEGNEADLAIWG